MNEQVNGRVIVFRSFRLSLPPSPPSAPLLVSGDPHGQRSAGDDHRSARQRSASAEGAGAHRGTARCGDGTAWLTLLHCTAQHTVLLL